MASEEGNVGTDGRCKRKLTTQYVISGFRHEVAEIYALLRFITQRVVAISYHYSLRNSLEERRSQLSGGLDGVDPWAVFPWRQCTVS